MLPLRKEIDEYSRSCEHLISAAASPSATPFTPEEIRWIAYYAGEMTGLVNRLSPDPKPIGDHKRKTIREYARACDALLSLGDLSEEDVQDIRRLVADITTHILDSRNGAASEDFSQAESVRGIQEP